MDRPCCASEEESTVQNPRVGDRTAERYGTERITQPLFKNRANSNAIAHHF